MFRQENTDGYSDAELDALNQEWATIVAAENLDPNADDYFARLRLESANIQDADGPYQVIAVNFAGYAGSEENPEEAQPIIPVYSLKGGIRSRSTAEHPDVVALTEVQRGLVKDTITDEYVWDFTDSKLKMRNGDQSNDFISVMKPTEIQPAGDAAQNDDAPFAAELPHHELRRLAAERLVVALDEEVGSSWVQQFAIDVHHEDALLPGLHDYLCQGT